MNFSNAIKAAVLAGTLVAGSTLAYVSTEGWYYAAIPIGSMDPEDIFLKGPFVDDLECDTVRAADYGDGDWVKPWDGGAGCFEVNENDFDVVNDYYEPISPFTPITSLGAGPQDLAELNQQLGELEAEYRIAEFEHKRDALIEQAAARLQPR